MRNERLPEAASDFFPSPWSYPRLMFSDRTKNNEIHLGDIYGRWRKRFLSFCDFNEFNYGRIFSLGEGIEIS